MDRPQHIIAALTMGLLSLAAVDAESANSKADVVQLTELACEMGRAYAQQDLAILDRLNAEDYMQTYTRGVVVERADYLEYVRQRVSKNVFSIGCDNIEVRLYGNAAVVTGGWTYTNHMPQGDLVTRTRWTSMWTRYPSGWKRHVFQNTYVNPQANQCALNATSMGAASTDVDGGHDATNPKSSDRKDKP